jgi:addiction module RelE/StbE family toxin
MKLRFTKLAIADLENILDYITERSPQGAKRVHARIQAVLDLIAKQPGIGAQTDKSSVRRAVTVPYPYLIFYEVTEQEVIVHTIRHGARETSNMYAGE